MVNFEIGDLVEVRRDNDLNPVLRFYYDKKAIITRILQIEADKKYIIIFETGRTFLAQGIELKLIAKANKDGKAK